MAEQVVAVRKLLAAVGPDPERLAACFGRKSQKRGAQISAILDTLKALGLNVSPLVMWFALIRIDRSPGFHPRKEDG